MWVYVYTTTDYAHMGLSWVEITEQYNVKTHPLFVFNIDISFMFGKVFRCVLIAFFSCNVQWSPLIGQDSYNTY